MRLYTQRDVTKAAEIKYETLQTWLERGLISSSHTLGDRPAFTEKDKTNIVRFAEIRREQRSLPRGVRALTKRQRVAEMRKRADSAGVNEATISAFCAANEITPKQFYKAFAAPVSRLGTRRRASSRKKK